MNPQYRPDDSDFAAKLRIKITNESEDTNMKKHLSMLLVTLLVIMAFATVAAARVEVCPVCDQGEIRSWSELYTTQPQDVVCPHGYDCIDSATETYRIYYTGCNNSLCSNKDETNRVFLYETVTCNKHTQNH